MEGINKTFIFAVEIGQVNPKVKSDLCHKCSLNTPLLGLPRRNNPTPIGGQFIPMLVG